MTKQRIDGLARARRGRFFLGGLVALAMFGLPTHAGPIQGAFSNPADYTEVRGLPPRPSAIDATVGELKALFGGAVRELFGEWSESVTSTTSHKVNGLLDRYTADVRVRIIEGFSRSYPILLADNAILVPKADGVIDPAQGPTSAAQVNIATACDKVTGSHTCEIIHEPGIVQRKAEVFMVVGWSVELARDVTTDSRSLVIIADRFAANGHTIKTGPLKLDGAPPNPNQSSPKAASGRSARHSGALGIFASAVDGVRANTTGLKGEQGLGGRKASGTMTATIENNRSENPALHCVGNVVEDAQAGGDGGGGSAAGQIVVRYATLIGEGPRRSSSKTKPLTERQCAERCGDPACGQNPAIAVCDVLREADNLKCSDGKDNDNDGYADCRDFSCSLNPWVTVCSGNKTVKEATPEACTDGVDNDGDGKFDCADPECQSREICGGRSGQPFVKTTGLEEASNANCGNGVDDDLDGKVDCDDPECRVNPYVTVCGGGERTIEACTDGKDNDNDQKVDCQDSGCVDNPYVLICEKERHPFLAESTAATCSDKLDNDKDNYVDCNDFQCRNNQLASSVCLGAHENTLAQCTNGKDDDGDGRVDCNDDTCKFNPFFGALICSQTPKAGHTQVTDAGPFYNGVFRESDASLIALGQGGGERGLAGTPLFARRTVRISFAPCEGDELDCEYDAIRECTISKAVSDSRDTSSSKAILDGVPGIAGAAGHISVRPIGRRTIDLARSLLSPRQWTVGTAQANAYFKRASAPALKDAGALYLHDIVRIRGVLSDEGIDCGPPPPSTAGWSARRVVLFAALCPSLTRDTVRLAYLASGRNFFGNSTRVALNPRERYATQYDAFMNRFNALDKNIDKWLSLANGLDTSIQLAAGESSFRDTAVALDGEIQLGRSKEAAALVALRAIEDKLNNRTSAIKNIKDQIETNNTSIKTKYQGKGLGDLILDLGAAFLKAYGGELLKSAGEAMLSQVGQDMKKLFDAEKPATPPGGGPKPQQSDAEKAFTAIWEQVKTSAEVAVKSEPVKKGASDVAAEIGKFLTGSTTNPVRSVMVDEVANELLRSSQLQITLDYLDLVIDKRKAQADYEIAQLERHVAEVRQSVATVSADRIAHYRASTELQAYDKILLGQQFYSNAILLVEDLTARYWKLLRQAEYEFLPYKADGGSELYSLIAGNYDFNLLNYQKLDDEVNKVNQDMKTRLRGGKSHYYRRVLASAVAPASDTDVARFEAIGLMKVPPFDQRKPMVLHLRVIHDDLAAHPTLRSMRNVRVDDVRVNVLGAGGTARPLVFVVRDGLDGFRTRRQGSKDLYADFDIAPLDLSGPGGGARSPLHYQSLSACVGAAPACDLASPGCATPFSAGTSTGTCGIFGAVPGPTPWLENTFYDRSLVGDWTVVIADDTLAGMGPVQAIEVDWLVASIPF